ncbi:hypothetical protein ACFY9R_26565 [Streptomyces albidoflavus]|uniref:hypothetical protein n=1 Tax=Streptomyces albidoflavus TaxID=1886 RepID=UPI0033FCEC22
MPQYLVAITYRTGRMEFRPAEDARNARRIVAGWKGRHPTSCINVFSINGTTNVTAEILPQKEA